MTIFRVTHNKNYTVINNTICTDSRLSWKAKGIWLYAFSRPDDWQFHISDLIKQSTDREASVKAGLRELQEAGYLLRVRRKEKNGQFSLSHWEFHETPQENLQELKKKVPQGGFPQVENPQVENQPLLSTDIPITEKQPIVVGEEHPPRSKKAAITKDDVYHYAVKTRTDWKPEEIESAWLAYDGAKAPITDAYAYIAGIIHKKRILSDAKQQKEKTCSKMKRKKFTNKDYSQKSEYSKPKQEYSEKDLPEPTLGKFDYHLKHKKSSRDS